MISKLFNQESKTIAGAALLIGVSSILSRVLGLFRDRLLVGRFGVGDELDAYYASFQVPNFLFALLILGTLSVAFIPVFTDYLAKGKRDEAWRMTNSLLSIVAVGMGVLSLALSLGAPWLVPHIAPGFTGEKLELTIRLTRVMMLSPFVLALSAVFSSVLNSNRRFLAVAVAPPIYNAAIIFGIVFLSKPFGVMGVAYGAIIGTVLHLLVQVPPALALGWTPRFVIDTAHAGVREVGKLFLPRVFGIDISQLSQFVGTAIGTTFGVGAPAIFNLAMNIAAVPLGVFAIPFSIAAFPALSEAAARGDRDAFRNTFAATFRQILFFLIPLSSMAFVLRVHVVRVLIGARSLSWHDTRLGAAALGLFAVSLAFQGLVPLLARAFYALKNTLIPVLISTGAMAVNIAAIFALKAWLSTGPGAATAWLWLGLYGVDDVRVLALSAAFSIASVLQVVLLAFILRRKFGRIGGTGILRAFGKFIAASAAAAWVAAAIVRPGLSDLDKHGSLSTLKEASLATLAGLAVYVLILRLLKSEELMAVAGAMHRRFLKVEKPLAVSDAQDL
ncbi:MAG TPA: murein biosynthesis integral membrane protein MurJ [Candidatus Baltobacteraceae bacterium]|nr:murein biosynthesis integral membrane protein MurJ [Candidatus Baltobacteraceae bacterium]